MHQEGVEPARKRVKTERTVPSSCDDSYDAQQNNLLVEHRGFGSGYAPKIEEAILLLVPVKDVLVSVSKVSRYLRALCSKDSVFELLMSRLGLCEIELLPASRELYLSSPERKWALVMNPCLIIKEGFELWVKRNVIEFAPLSTPEGDYSSPDADGFQKTVNILHDKGLQVPPSLQQLGHLTSCMRYQVMRLVPGGLCKSEQLLTPWTRPQSWTEALRSLYSYLFHKYQLFAVGLFDWQVSCIPFLIDLNSPTISHKFNTMYGLHLLTKEVNVLTLESMVSDWAESDTPEDENSYSSYEWKEEGLWAWFDNIDRIRHAESDIYTLLKLAQI